MAEPMWNKEMKRRLNSGEDPLLIARDKWVRLCTMIEEGCTDGRADREWMKYIIIGADSCALCDLYLENDCGDDGECCTDCPIDCLHIWSKFARAWNGFMWRSKEDGPNTTGNVKVNDLLARARDVQELIEDAIQNKKRD